jgi:hypothetical protein
MRLSFFRELTDIHTPPTGCAWVRLGVWSSRSSLLPFSFKYLADQFESSPGHTLPAYCDTSAQRSTRKLVRSGYSLLRLVGVTGLLFRVAVSTAMHVARHSNDVAQSLLTSRSP